MNLLKEAVNITNDLREVVFVGSMAVFAYIGPHRQTSDIDFALASTISDELLISKGYEKWKERKEVWYSPNGVRIDFFRKDVGGILIPRIFSSAFSAKVGKENIRVMGLEELLLSKLRAGRSQDNQDIQEICTRLNNKINLERILDIASEIELDNLRTAIKAHRPRSSK